MKSKRFASVLSIALTVMFGTGSASGALMAYLRVAGIDGESNADQFQGWSDLLGYNISVQSDGWEPPGSAGRASLSPMFVQKYVDSASPKFFGGVLTGMHFPTAQIDVRRAGPDSTKFVLWELEDVVLASYSTGGSADAAVEAVALDYRRIKYTYWPQLPDGSLGAPVVFGWDKVTNSTFGSGSFADFEFVTNFGSAAVPEPGTLALLSCSLAVVVPRRRRPCCVWRPRRAARQASELTETRVSP